MELEAQVKISTNQARRQDEQNKALEEKLEQSVKLARDQESKVREQGRKYSDLESKVIRWFFLQLTLK